MPLDRIRILFFESGHLGGSIKSLGGLLRGLSRLDCDVDVVSWYRPTGPVDIFALECVQDVQSLNVAPGKRPVLGKRTLGIPHPTGLALRYFPLAWRVLARFQPDIAYLISASSHTFRH